MQLNNVTVTKLSTVMGKNTEFFQFLVMKGKSFYEMSQRAVLYTELIQYFTQLHSLHSSNDLKRVGEFLLASPVCPLSFRSLSRPFEWPYYRGNVIKKITT